MSNTYRCREVVLTGLVWIIAGLSTVFGGVLVYGDSRGSHWSESLVFLLVGLIVLICGIAFATARMEITPTSIISVWAFSHSEYPLDELSDATLAQPRSRSDHADPVGYMLRPGGGIYLGIFSFVFNLLSQLMSWIVLPGSGHDQVLHLVKNYGGSTTVPAISARSLHHCGEANVAYAAVIAAIKSRRSNSEYLSTRSSRELWMPEKSPTVSPAIPSSSEARKTRSASSPYPLGTIEYIIENPNRSLAWKVIDISIVCGLWLVAISSFLVLIAGVRTGDFSGTIEVVFLLAFLGAVVFSSRSWYLHVKVRQDT